MHPGQRAGIPHKQTLFPADLCMGLPRLPLDVSRGNHRDVKASRCAIQVLVSILGQVWAMPLRMQMEWMNKESCLVSGFGDLAGEQADHCGVACKAKGVGIWPPPILLC